jgi:hypothetical protein
MKYASEERLCAEFIEMAQANGWVAYPETGDFDILLVDPSGDQIGVEAKLRANFHVLSQALPRFKYQKHTGPDFRAVLVPKSPAGFAHVCMHLNLVLFTMEPPKRRHADHIKNMFNKDRYTRWSPKKRITLPDYIPDVAAGASAPLKLTTWKVKALRLLARAEHNGFVTSKDAKDLEVDFQYFTTQREKYRGMLPWLTRSAEKDGRRTKWMWIDSDDPKRPDNQHPTIYVQVLAEYKEEQ